MTKEDPLVAFLTESNAIEGITRPVTDDEVAAAKDFLALREISIPELQRLVTAFQPDAVIRASKGLDVRVGNHLPPSGGPQIARLLGTHIAAVNASDSFHAWRLHLGYEALHPFTDGNGRSGRMLWLWSMLKDNGIGSVLRLSFLHRFYYQTLKESCP